MTVTKRKTVPSHYADMLVVGSGMAGATIARLAAEAGQTVHVIEKRSNVGGNCFSTKDLQTGIEIHPYGPHIFHTNSHAVWEFVNRFSSFNNYIHRVKVRSRDSVYSLPVNLHLINQFFRKSLSPYEARRFLREIRFSNLRPLNFEDYLLSKLGPDLYDAFFRGYTKKQWGVSPRTLPASLAMRIPIRFNYDDKYFEDLHQGIPLEGFGTLFQRILKHGNIKVFLSTSFEEKSKVWRRRYKKLAYTGSIDEYFDFACGVLPYRTVTFRTLRGRDILGTAVMNFADGSIPYTRVHEPKWFISNTNDGESVAFEEYAGDDHKRSNPCYPIPGAKSNSMISEYRHLARGERDVLFIGRLAEYSYYNMDQVILLCFRRFHGCRAGSKRPIGLEIE